MKFIKHKVLFVLTFGYGLLAGASQSLLADEYQLDTHFCFGNSRQVIIEGRVIERRFLTTPASGSDSAIKNIWNRLNQFFNEEEKSEPVYLNMPNGLFKTRTDDEGYFRFDLNLHKPLPSGYQSIQLWLEDEQTQAECQLYIIPDTASLGIISDFDDTVIVSDVNDKLKLLENTFAKNFTQREVVKGVAEFYQNQLKKNPQPEIAPLIFVSGSPRQIQQSIEDFLDLHQFPHRVVITKKLNGKNSDPLFNQLNYKTQKIEELFMLFPNLKFLLVGDDGEKDPEVYQYFQQKFPDQVAGVWIRQVSRDANRQKFSGQKYFKADPAE